MKVKHDIRRRNKPTAANTRFVQNRKRTICQESARFTRKLFKKRPADPKSQKSVSTSPRAQICVTNDGPGFNTTMYMKVHHRCSAHETHCHGIFIGRSWRPVVFVAPDAPMYTQCHRSTDTNKMPQKLYIAAGYLRCVLGGRGQAAPFPPNPHRR